MNNLYEQGIGGFLCELEKKGWSVNVDQVLSIELIINSSIFILSRGIHSQDYKCIIIKEKEEKLIPFSAEKFLDAPTLEQYGNYHSTQDAEAGILGNLCWYLFHLLVQWCL